MANLQVCFVRKEPPDTTHRPKMANPISSMDFLKRKAEELRSKGTRRVMGSHPVPGTTPRREAEEPPRNRLRMGGGRSRRRGRLGRTRLRRRRGRFEV